MKSFAQTGLQENILSAVEALGFETPTPIQAEAIPIILDSNQDIIALAQTGTGKTAAFGLPSIQRTNLNNKACQTLILSPTRELCLQITKDLEYYAKHINKLAVVAVYGGSSIHAQIKELNKSCHIVVATPGRCKDLIKRKKLHLNQVERVVLDEADEMLTMGFKEDLDFILSHTPKEKQTLLFSATMSKEVMRITKTYMQDPVEITVAAKNIGAENVEHVYYVVNARDRYQALKRIADYNTNIYAIVFCRTRRETKEVANKLMSDGYSADALHGDLSQAQRDDAMKRFRTKQLQMLVATDVAARGIDVDDLTHVINYNLPDSAEVYTHRSGRTGRAGKNGISVVIMHGRENRKLAAIENLSKIKFKKGALPSGQEICEKQLYMLIDKVKAVKVDEKQIGPYLEEIYNKFEGLDREELIKHFVSTEFNRFLAYYKNASDLNTASSGEPATSREKSRQSDRERSKDLARLYINLGSKHNVKPARLMGIINESLKSGNVEIGKIELMKKFSFFEIEKSAVEPLLASLNGSTIDGQLIVLEVAEARPEVKPREKNRERRRSGGGFKKDRSGGGGRRSRSGESRVKDRKRSSSGNKDKGRRRRK